MKVKPQTEETKKKKMSMYNTALEFYYYLLETYFEETMFYRMLKTVKLTSNMILLI